MKNYPKKSGQYSQKKLESAFIKTLQHVLSKKYQYIIVGDRGFGTLRFIDLCMENNF